MNNILVLTYWSYKSGLIQAYTLPYLRMISENLPPGSRIYLVTLEQAAMELDSAETAAACEELAACRIEWKPFSYHSFGLKAVLAACWRIVPLLGVCWRWKIRRIHCYCTPAGALGYVLSCLTGIPLLIDSYEPHAESMIENGTWKKTGAAFRILFLFEKLQSRRAETVIATTSGMRGYAESRYGARFTDFHVKPACVDLDLFCREGMRLDGLRKELGLENRIVCVYAGKTGGIYLEGEIFDILKVASDYWGERFRALLLTGDDEDRIRGLARRSGLRQDVLICRFVEHKDMPKYLALADFALTPVKSVPTKRHAAPIKDGEYWAMGLPVIITPGIADDSDIIEEHGIGSVLKDLTGAAYLRSIRQIDALFKDGSRAALRHKIRSIAAKKRSLNIAAAVYRTVYGSDCFNEMKSPARVP